MNIIEKTKTIRKKVVEIYLLFCFYSLPFCGLVMLPGLFFSWWELHISYPFVVILGVIIPMIAVLSLVVMVTVLFLTKKSKSDPSIMSVLKIGKICFSSDVYFFNDDPDIHNAEERVVLKAAEFNIFLFIDNDYQVGILQLSTSESYSPLGEIIKDDIIYPNRYVVVDSGTMYLMSKSPMVYTSFKSEFAEFDVNELLEFGKVDDDYSCLKIKPIFGDGDYRIKIKNDSTESILVVEILGGAFEGYAFYPECQLPLPV